MSTAQFGDAGRDKLRILMASVEQELGLLPSTTHEGLRAAWANLVGAMDLGLAAETRECPTCKSVGMRDATRCSRCWNALVPLPSERIAVEVAR